ncbi:hypothetical protein [Polyangium sorediatum]|uniref:SMP-30/Gluconolactonase/LRE-like region domain-containing protein n=1 Tax=Polyangium sorediatum TaxID=889274 RepID=A0ABT6NZA2_9BACT|nr:hypothetical protein [Polyangium sorediatum]MDI1433679.1 hypothetical protein [Polyangium sorediatum]
MRLPIPAMVIGLSLASGGVAHATDLDVLVKGAKLHSANGLASDGLGHLYAASVFGNEIVKIRELDGKILSRRGMADGVQFPDDLTLGPDGSIYWTSLLVGQVGRRKPNGVTSFQSVAPGVNPITFSNGHRLFTALAFLGDALYELSPTFSAPPRLITTNLGFVNGMDWGPDGRLYGPVSLGKEIISIDVDSCENATDPYNECDITLIADDFFQVSALKFDAFGRLFAVDINGDVLRINVATGAKSVVARLPLGNDNLTFDSWGRVVVSNGYDGTITRINYNGSRTILVPGGAIVPSGVAVLADGCDESVFVGDFIKLRTFDGDTGKQTAFAPTLAGVPGALPPSITASRDGDHILTTAWYGNSVAVWDPAAEAVVETYPGYVQPLNAIKFQGHLVVAEYGAAPGAARVILQVGATRITLTDTLAVPTGLAAAGDDLWAADWSSGTVWQLIDDGVHLASPLLVAYGLSNPEGLAVDLDGTLLVVEAGAGRLSRIDPDTGVVWTVVSGLSPGLPAPAATPPSYFFSGVDVGPSGTIYFSNDASSRVYRLTD